MARRRADGHQTQGDIDANRLVFIDETWAKTNMTRVRGRAPGGSRVIDKTPHGHWKTTTQIAALDITGVRCSTVVDGAVNGDVFEAFVAQVLVPQLQHGDIVVMDNLSSHKRERTRLLIEQRGAQLVFLPPYSPDLIGGTGCACLPMSNGCAAAHPPETARRRTKKNIRPISPPR